MGHMAPGIFVIIIIPLLEMRNSILIGISTIKNDSTFYTKLLELRDNNGDLVFLSYRHELICDRCMKTQFMNKCRHLAHEVPPWKSIDQLDISEKLYGLEGRGSDMTQESMYVDQHNTCTSHHRRNSFTTAIGERWPRAMAARWTCTTSNSSVNKNTKMDCRLPNRHMSS